MVRLPFLITILHICSNGCEIMSILDHYAIHKSKETLCGLSTMMYSSSDAIKIVTCPECLEIMKQRIEQYQK